MAAPWLASVIPNSHFFPWNHVDLIGLASKAIFIRLICKRGSLMIRKQKLCVIPSTAWILISLMMGIRVLLFLLLLLIPGIRHIVGNQEMFNEWRMIFDSPFFLSAAALARGRGLLETRHLNLGL